MKMNVSAILWIQSVAEESERSAVDGTADPALGYFHLILGGTAALIALGLTIWFLLRPDRGGEKHPKRLPLRERDADDGGAAG